MTDSAVLPFLTIGHSNRSIEAFLALLRGAQVECVVDVRKMPMSRANPQFNGEALATALAAGNIAYTHLSALAGLRKKSREVSADTNGFWQNRSFHNYADYALSDAFHAGLSDLIAMGRQQRCVLMCSEAVWWRCHRRLIADNLIAHGENVLHIMGTERLEPAQLTSGAIVRNDAKVVYPAIGAPNTG